MAGAFQCSNRLCAREASTHRRHQSHVSPVLLAWSGSWVLVSDVVLVFDEIVVLVVVFEDIVVFVVVFDDIVVVVVYDDIIVSDDTSIVSDVAAFIIYRIPSVFSVSFCLSLSHYCLGRCVLENRESYGLNLL